MKAFPVHRDILGLFAFFSNSFPQEDAQMQSFLLSVCSVQRGSMCKAVHFLCRTEFYGFGYLKHRSCLSLTLNSSSCTIKSLLRKVQPVHSSVTCGRCSPFPNCPFEHYDNRIRYCFKLFFFRLKHETVSSFLSGYCL